MTLNIKYNLLPDGVRRKDNFRSESTLDFGRLRTDHMFLMNYVDGNWTNPRIVPYGNLSIPPGAIGLHYGQELFEGAKAFMHDNKEIYTFRLDKNAKRLNKSADLMCMPSIPTEDQIQTIHALIDVDRLCCPQHKNDSLYVRPFMIGTQNSLSVHPSSTYTFCIILSPSGPYYKNGFTEPIKLLITNKHHRAAPGGIGSAKAAGNYGGSLKAQKYAEDLGASQVLYLSTDNRYIEEAGSMNHFHVTKDDKIIIPTFTDTILKSITSESVIDLADSLNVEVKQERITLEDFLADIKSGNIKEAGGLGTAAVVTSVGSYILEDKEELVVGNGDIGSITRHIYDTISDIQSGTTTGPDGWMKKVDRIH